MGTRLLLFAGLVAAGIALLVRAYLEVVDAEEAAGFAPSHGLADD